MKHSTVGKEFTLLFRRSSRMQQDAAVESRFLVPSTRSTVSVGSSRASPALPPFTNTYHSTRTLDTYNNNGNEF